MAQYTRCATWLRLCLRSGTGLPWRYSHPECLDADSVPLHLSVLPLVKDSLESSEKHPVTTGSVNHEVRRAPWLLVYISPFNFAIDLGVRLLESA